MFDVRRDEPEYAFLPAADAPERNRYGRKIQLVGATDVLAGTSLNINGDGGVGSNPNRYKQHGFHFNADNCISCHACESACSEKNDLPAHLAFRAVGYVEGGSYPAYRRLNISMACNHCDNPVCLKGCPTRAYTKFAEYGAVLQDPDICFGCGYCTWVCPYNAPQLDPVNGRVEKCNMCVDRLEVGLKPACAAACLAGALDFGVIETRPENRDQLETRIPGFPDPRITQPNIRFQQTRSLPRELGRTDDMPLRYARDGQGGGAFKTKVREDHRRRRWNLRKLRSREDPLVVFTLVSQAVIGAFLVLFLAPKLGVTALAADAHPVLRPLLLFALLGLETFALVLSTLHLGKPHRFYRALNNLRYSPVSREVAGLAVFSGLLGVYALLAALPGIPLSGRMEGPGDILGWAAAAAGTAAIYFMHAIYRIRARPFWDHWQTLTSFLGNTLALGSLLVGIVYASVMAAGNESFAGLMSALAWPALAGLVMEAAGLWFHQRALGARGGEGAASRYEQRTTFGKTSLARNAGLGVSIALVAVLGLLAPAGAAGLALWVVAALAVAATATVGRALFYVLVIPTTMPGAFFWRNRGFQEHARESGLARVTECGVLPDAH